MTIVARAYADAGLEFPKYAVAITMEGSKMDKLAQSQGWLERFPMFDWIGGRTSELSAVGLLPAALQGLDINGDASGCGDVRRGDASARYDPRIRRRCWR